MFADADDLLMTRTHGVRVMPECWWTNTVSATSSCTLRAGELESPDDGGIPRAYDTLESGEGRTASKK